MGVLLVSPTEHTPLASKGTVSSLPEKHGVDYLWMARKEWWGVQRKEVKDLLASVQDGRLGREVGMMRVGVCLPVVLVEGQVRWTTDGKLVWQGWGQEWTRGQWDRLMFSLMVEGVHVVYALSPVETKQMVLDMKAWTEKARHTSLVNRPGAFNAWGKATNRDYGIHLLQGLPGVGPELAGRIWDRFGVPWGWKVTKEEMMTVEGLGKKKVDQMWEVFGEPD